MGKVSKPKNQNTKGSDMLTERRKMGPGTVQTSLKRSKSVRASLRLIGSRILHKNNENRPNGLQKSPSMHSLITGRKDYFMLPNVFEREPAETILKTPMTGVKITTPPSVVPPKAAAMLQVPLKENRETVCYREEKESWFLHRNGRRCDLNGRFDDLDTAFRSEGFQRTSLRLSITTKRRNAVWNNSFSSTSSRFKIGVFFFNEKNEAF